jgi:hypothetical protein
MKKMSTTALAALVMTLLVVSVSAHLKVVAPASRHRPTDLTAATCCSASARLTAPDEKANYMCGPEAVESTRLSATGAQYQEGRKYTVRVHLSVNHGGLINHGLLFYQNAFAAGTPDPAVKSTLSLTSQDINAAQGPDFFGKWKEEE